MQDVAPLAYVHAVHVPLTMEPHFTQLAPFAVYPVSHVAAVQVPDLVHAVHVPFATVISEHGIHPLSIKSAF